MRKNRNIFFIFCTCLFVFVLFCNCTLPLNETKTDTVSTSRPVQPTGISSSSDYDGITISWSTVQGALRYKIYYAVSNTSFSTDCFYETKANSYTDTLLYAGDIWFYRVSAVNLNGESECTNPVYSARRLEYGNQSQIPYYAAEVTVYSKDDTTVNWTLNSITANDTVYYFFPVHGGKTYKIYWIDSKNNASKLTDLGYTTQAYIKIYYYPAGSSSTTFYYGDSGTTTLYTSFKSQITGYYLIKIAGKTADTFGYYGLCVVGE
jgi:hypothetical protein